MKIRYNDKEIGRIDARFYDWQLSEGKDTRIRKHRKSRNFRLPQIKGLLRRVIILALVLAFLGLHLKEKPKQVTPEPVTQENAIQAIVESAHAKTPDMVASGIVYQEDLFVKNFGSEAETMRAICKAESGLDTNAIGDTNTKYPSVGLCQIRLLPERQITMEQMKIPEENLKYAKLLYDKYGWKPWSAWKDGSYLKYLLSD